MGKNNNIFITYSECLDYDANVHSLPSLLQMDPKDCLPKGEADQLSLSNAKF
jgi:hypothetical protein